jgi:para-nitrobenzyl esterase
VRIYRGIPYAAPPVGALRFKAPQPVTPWEGIREATVWSRMTPQRFPSGPVSDNVQESGMGEDSLYLNVVTPAKSAGERLPVMVWFHGGGLTSGWGNSDSVNSPALPREGVVVVTVNHRLGALGYLAHPALSKESERGVSGNYGSLDTLAALQWVERNIASFGGDPQRVTIFGVSGGGQKVLWLMASPLAKGLFHRAIVMSGGVGGTPLAEAEKYGENLAKALGVDGEADVAAALRAKPWQEIVKAGLNEASGYRSIFTIDGWSLDGVAATSDVPIIMGFMGAEKEQTRSPAFIARAITPATSELSTRYAYTFTHIPHAWGSRGALAYHGGDVAYAFGVPEEIRGHYGNLFRPDAKLEIPRDPGLDERDEWVAQATMKMWVRFAETGDPNLDEATLRKLGKSWSWPKLDASDQYLEIGVTPRVRSGWVAGAPDQQAPRY